MSRLPHLLDNQLTDGGLKYKGVRKIVGSKKDEVRNSGLYITTINMIQNYWVFGLFSSSGILENRKHDVSETESVSALG
jgi:hypothetical protein